MLSNHRLLLIVSIIWGYFSVQAQEFMFKRHEVDIIPEFTYNLHYRQP